MRASLLNFSIFKFYNTVFSKLQFSLEEKNSLACTQSLFGLTLPNRNSGFLDPAFSLAFSQSKALGKAGGLCAFAGSNPSEFKKIDHLG